MRAWVYLIFVVNFGCHHNYWRYPFWNSYLTVIITKECMTIVSFQTSYDYEIDTSNEFVWWMINAQKMIRGSGRCNRLQNKLKVPVHLCGMLGFLESRGHVENYFVPLQPISHTVKSRHAVETASIWEWWRHHSWFSTLHSWT